MFVNENDSLDELEQENSIKSNDEMSTNLELKVIDDRIKLLEESLIREIDERLKKFTEINDSKNKYFSNDNNSFAINKAPIILSLIIHFVIIATYIVLMATVFKNADAKIFTGGLILTLIAAAISYFLIISCVNKYKRMIINKNIIEHTTDISILKRTIAYLNEDMDLDE